MAQVTARRGVATEFFTGIGLLFRGLKVWVTAPKLMLLGMIPAFLVALAMAAGVIALGVNLENIATALTPFAETWQEPFRTGIRIVAAAALLALAVLIVIYAFTTITLIVGAPFYEQIWAHVERSFGALPENPLGFWPAFWRSLGAGLRLLVPTILLGIALFAVGLIPIVGQVLVPILGALVGGWYLTLELTGLAFDGRGMTFSQRRSALKARRATTAGFGAATYLSFLVPLGAVIMMPAAVAGATLLARRSLGEADIQPSARSGADAPPEPPEE